MVIVFKKVVVVECNMTDLIDMMFSPPFCIIYRKNSELWNPYETSRECPNLVE
jgi:hypothetical protein